MNCLVRALIERNVNENVFGCLQVDMVCGDHLLDHYQSLRDIQKSVGKEALQVPDEPALMLFSSVD